MSLNRITAAQKIIASSSKVYSVPNCLRCVRWQNTGPVTRGVSTFKVLVYGVSATGMVVGTSLVFANYNSSFRFKVDEYIPGFARSVDFAADKWVQVVDAIKPKSTDNVGLRKDLGSVLESRMPSRKQTKTETQTPPVEMPAGSDTPTEEKATVQPKEAHKEERSDAKELTADLAESKSSVNETSDKDVETILPTKESTEPSVTLSTDVVHGESLKSSSNKEDMQEKEASAAVGESHNLIVESQPDPAQYAVDSEISGSSGEGEVAIEEKPNATTGGLQSHQHSDKSYGWLNDAAQAETLLQEVYDKFKELDKRTYELRKDLIEAEKCHREKVAQSTTIDADDKSVMQVSQEDLTKADDEVQAAIKKLVASQLESNEVGQDLMLLFERASALGLRSKVDEIRNELSQLHVRTMMSACERAEERHDGGVAKENQQKIEEVVEWMKNELGVTLPQADSLQESIILMLKEKVKLLMQKVEGAEKEYQNYLSAALEKQKEELERITEEKVQLQLQERERELWKEAQKKQTKAVQKREEELKEQLFIQTEAHTQHLSEALQTQAEQLEAKWASQMEAKLSQQENYYQMELVKAFARLRGIEAMVDTVANAGETTRQQQSLRTACDTLNAALEQADLKIDPSERYSFAKEVSSLREAAHGDHFILSVLNSIPHEAVSSENGIQSEAGLQQRFRKVKKICKKVALVPEVGGGLGTYALSYLHSFLAINVWRYSSAVEYGRDPMDMDTFELLHYAENSLRQGNVEEAIKLINCLTGEPRRVAQDWLRDAQLHLETKQAIHLLQNYMAANSLAIIQ